MLIYKYILLPETEWMVCLGSSDSGLQLVSVDENGKEKQMLWLSIRRMSIFALY